MRRIIIIYILLLFSYNTSLGVVYYVNENDSVAKKGMNVSETITILPLLTHL